MHGDKSTGVLGIVRKVFVKYRLSNHCWKLKPMKTHDREGNIKVHSKVDEGRCHFCLLYPNMKF